MILFALCLAGTAACYVIGVKNPGVGTWGTPKGWIISLVIGSLLALIFYAFSAFGLIVSIDSLFSDF